MEVEPCQHAAIQRMTAAHLCRYRREQHIQVHVHAQAATPMAMTKLADKTVPSPSVTPSTAPSESTPAASASLDGRTASLPPISTNTTHWNGQGLGMDRPDWAGAPPHDAPAENEPHVLSQRLESIGQRPSMPSQRLESLAGDDQSRILLQILQRWLPSKKWLCWTITLLCDGHQDSSQEHSCSSIIAHHAPLS